jgi:hypothetical protein
MVKLDWNGNPQFSWDASGEGPGQFREIHQFSVDSEKNFYGAGNVLGRVQKFVPKEGASFMETFGAPDPALQ